MAEDPDHLILKFLHGSCSAEESERLNAWLAKSAENQKMFEDLKQVWQHSHHNMAIQDFQTAQEWGRFIAAVETRTSSEGAEVERQRLKAFSKTENDSKIHAETYVSPVRKVSPYWWLKIAASITFLIVATFFAYRFFFTTSQTVHQSYASTLHVALPDGSEVWLNEHSRLSYDDDYNNDIRLVQLEGEAFFDVTKNPRKPFTVRLQDSEVKVLGTSFNIQAHAKSPIAEVFVKTGLVSFSVMTNQSKEVTLKPGETGRLIKNVRSIEQSVSDNYNVLAWKEKRLVFKKTTLREVVKTLEKYFKIYVTVENDRLLNCRFTSTFNNPELEEVLEALKVSLNLSVSSNNNLYTIKGEGC